ncbi:MAG: RecQ family ATP-dependent DNA helicase [Verrucomicrobia bacterium]|nr:RecQ family ATP-dependent DNA helicase [Verrucomicrobiota bacterium]
MPQTAENQQERLDGLLQHALLLDLEVSHQGKIFKIGAVLGNATLPRSGQSSATLHELSVMGQSANCVLGHNLVSHDLTILRETAANHPLLKLPVIDTLLLSPIAFPENPYHRLIKDYKLVRESVNDPVADARQAAMVFQDEFRSLSGLRQTEPRLFELLHFLLATPDETTPSISKGMELFFGALGGSIPSRTRALELCRELFAEWACNNKPVEELLFQTANSRLSLAYALTWLRVAGTNSVLPPWVRLQHPLTGKLIQWLRESPCDSPACSYCRKVYDAREQLSRFFNWTEFRALPKSPGGGSLQQEIVEAGLRNESMLAILPTGGGKSICFQLPALTRNFRRGVLTLVISPLQALMKDQVEGLIRRTGTPFAAALSGLLTPMERADVLQRVRMGDVALLYISPEQLRNRSFCKAIAQREIGCWVFDEAHCLSKWGHDFRPDYLYAGRFIREFAREQGVEIPAIVGFTATAKRDVKEEIITFFQTETGRDLKLFEGGVERNNLKFQVQSITRHGKLERIHDLLSDRLGQTSGGCAIVFRATRDATEQTAKFLQEKEWSAANFHAGLTPPEKKRIQDEFLAGNTKVICATNAFGMGIDKENVRLVIHADTPGSLENYLQEAGRAGRDGLLAECVLLYDEDDCEKQFRLGSFSELTRRDIAQILRSLRKSARGEKEEIVITAGEILRDEDIQTSLDAQDRNADTKVRAAISWLERSGFLQRDENVTNVFQARLLVRDLHEAEAKMNSLNLSQNEKALWLAILREFINAGIQDSLTVDQLAVLPEFASYAKGGPNSGAKVNPEFISGKILKILGSMAQVGIMKRDLLLSAFVRHKVGDHSRIRFDRVVQLDRKLLDLLITEAPDPEGWLPLSLRLINQRLCDEGFASSTELIRQLLKSLTEDGRGFAGTHGSIEVRYIAQDSYRVRVRRSWSDISALAEKRRRTASVVLDVLFAKIPRDASASAELLIEFSFDELRKAIESDLLLRSDLKDIDAALERALMFLHEQQVIILQQGLAVFRSAMTIRLQPGAKGERYKSSDYQPLEHHYRERILQVHVMSEFARRGVEAISEALRLVLAYFTLDKEEFLQTYFRSKLQLLQYATTARSFQRIVSDLNNPAQIKIVTAPASRDMLVLAGPGSGKTKTVVHRCAYLLRVERVRPQSILICCFNRSAALELRRRLVDLTGDDARGVTVLTYHGLAMRLLGYSFMGRTNTAEINFDELIKDAVKLLRGETTLPGIEPDDARDRLLAGFQHILVDEYQDIDEPQYQMISAIAGRTLDDADLKLSILAVGDDDQNIYSFRGANVEFIRRFQDDYKAEIYPLVENYRSTRYIIEAANSLISANSDRMKTEHPIRIDRYREMLPAGGVFAQRDDLTRGKVQVIRVKDGEGQARAVISEIRRLKQIGVSDLSRIAVLSSHHRDLAQVRTLAEQAGVPIVWYAGQGGIPQLYQVREIYSFLQHLVERKNLMVRASALIDTAEKLLEKEPLNRWLQFLCRIVEAWKVESNDAELPAQFALEFLYETCAESRRDLNYGEGVRLSTVHSAKGTEYDHVLLTGSWPLLQQPSRQEEARRAFYVGMTRARQSLSIFDRADVGPSLPQSLSGPSILQRASADDPATPPIMFLNYATLGMQDIHLSFPGRFNQAHPIHAALSWLQPNSKLQMREENGSVSLFNDTGAQVARLSRKSESAWLPRLGSIREVRVLAMVHRSVDQETVSTRRDQYNVSEWEIPIVELCYEDSL